MIDQSQYFQHLRLIYLGAIGKTFWLNQFLNKHLKCENLEEIGWTIISSINKIDF